MTNQEPTFAITDENPEDVYFDGRSVYEIADEEYSDYSNDEISEPGSIFDPIR